MKRLGPSPATYGEKFEDAKGRIEEYLRGRKAKVIKVSDIRRYLHGSGAEAFIAPVLMAIEADALIECVAVEGKGGLVYFLPKWYGDEPTTGGGNVSE